MTPLTAEYIGSCPVHRGFRQRGMDMTRIEVFVDAGFAFALLAARGPWVGITRNRSKPKEND